MTMNYNYHDREAYPDSYILTVVLHQRKTTLRRDYIRHKWKVIRMLVGIDRYDADLMLRCVSWMNRLKTLMQQASIEA